MLSHMTLKQGGHLERDQTKIAIIEFILNSNKEGNDPGILQSKIRNYLEITYGMTDRKNIGNLLKYLSAETEGPCLEKSSINKPGKPNYWDITKIKHLSNIRSKFPDILLHDYGKSILIVLKKNGYDIRNLQSRKLYVQLLFSPSFFNACIDTNIETLCERAWGIYTDDECYLTGYLKNDMKNYYNEYMARYPIIEMSYESFVSKLTQISKRKEIYQVEPPTIGSEYQTEKFMEIWEKELLGIHKEKANGIYTEKMEEDLEIYSKMMILSDDLSMFVYNFESKSLDIVFKHYFDQDILDDSASIEEREFARKIKANHDNESEWLDDIDEYIGPLVNQSLSNLEQTNTKYEKDINPSIFGRLLI
jgi:hypothetical protein